MTVPIMLQKQKLHVNSLFETMNNCQIIIMFFLPAELAKEAGNEVLSH